MYKCDRLILQDLSQLYGSLLWTDRRYPLLVSVVLDNAELVKVVLDNVVFGNVVLAKVVIVEFVVKIVVAALVVVGKLAVQVQQGA